MSLKIVLLKDTKPLDEFVFNQPLVTIGRRGESDIPIKDPAVSGAHAQIVCVDGSYTINDLASTNGVYVGGRRVEQQKIKHNDLITIGEHLLHVIISATLKAPLKHASAYLLVVKGGTPGARIALQTGLTTVGEPGIQVAAVSKRPQGHFIIHVDGGKDRSRVPMVNGEPTGFKSRKLEPGDTIDIAGVLMEYRLQ
ncbi:MAG: pSer/pThr/pTyr-binding forkhead associated (FHA) protein [Candidatus Pseudothioglobus sp.]|jgi:pSer/pThr/pTyr-binding forkhead associated (FHA) protein